RVQAAGHQGRLAEGHQAPRALRETWRPQAPQDARGHPPPSPAGGSDPCASWIPGMTRQDLLRVKEPFSCFSHLVGVVLAIPGLVWLIYQSHGDPWRTVGFSVYGTSLILLYTASTVYHWLPVAPRTEDLLRRLDHVAIYCLIAGSYTPVCLVTLRGGWGWSLFAAAWAAAAV